MALSGAHGALGTWGYTFRWEDIPQVFTNWSSSTGPHHPALRRYLSFLVVAISEALRYTVIREGIVDVINKTGRMRGHRPGPDHVLRNNSRYNSRWCGCSIPSAAGRA
jgi:hypothetical protein